MPKQSKGYTQQPNLEIQNNFAGGLKTEFTGLNFPPNACTAVNNCVFNIVGDVTRRPGINLEANFVMNNVMSNSAAISSYRWRNAGGDGKTEIVVVQAGATLYFFESSNSTTAQPLSAQNLNTVINFNQYLAPGSTSNPAQAECQFADGNGYLFVFHPDCDPFYCTFNAGAIVSNVITIQIRDFLGFYPEPGNPAINFRPLTLSDEHNYNLQNQGWTGASLWTANSNTNFVSHNNTDGGTVFNNTGTIAFTVSSGITGISPGQAVVINWSVQVLYEASGSSHTYVGTGASSAQGSVISYSGTTLTINVSTSGSQSIGSGSAGIIATSSSTETISLGVVNSTITTFHNDEGLFPSNADIWFTFKNSSGIFDPTTTYASVILTTTPAPRGHFILNAFNMLQSNVSGLASLTNLSTIARPSTGCWFQGRIWYSGINASQPASGDQNFYTWSENIYFSQVIRVNDVTSFGYCYQTNDPTDENTFELLPTDGGVITIQGCGNIYKLFPVQNGVLVFAQNGVWFITGDSGLGFTANDYRIDPIPNSPQCISAHNIVSVLGLPMFWNEEGIYQVNPVQGNVPYGHGGFTVEPMTIKTILTFYNSIPKDSKRFARAAYNPITYVVEWIYRSTQESGIANRYQYDSLLCYNTLNKSFYPYTVSSVAGTTPFINGIFYLSYPSSLNTPNPSTKFIATIGDSLSFAEENDNVSYLDWNSIAGQNYTSTFTTGYSLPGQSHKRFQPVYLYMYYRTNSLPSSYLINTVWNFASTADSGKIGGNQLVTNGLGNVNYGMNYRRHKLRGHGLAFQFTVTSVQGIPFDFMGWAVPQTINVVD